MTAKEIHKKAEVEREKDNHLEALRLIEEAIVAYQKESNYSGLTKVLQSRVLTYKHLFLLSKDVVFALLAQKDAESSLEIAQRNSLEDKYSSCYYRLGEVSMLFKDYLLAEENYKKALDQYQGSKSEKGDYRYHLGEAMYRSGNKKEGKSVLLQGLSEIQDNANEVDPFLIHVWESGCYMRLAELLVNDEPKQAKEYFDKAKEIAQLDDKLVIRRRQITELSKWF